MPRYFFHISDPDGWIKDEEGLNLWNFDAAKQEARDTARDFAAAKVREGKPVDGRKVVVIDEDGRHVYELAVKDVIDEMGN